LPIGHDDHDIGAGLANPGLGGLVLDPLWLKDLEAKFQGEQLGSRLEQLESTPRHPIGLRHNQGNVVASLA
jgi:hypothetical protein